MIISVFDTVKNMVGKGEIACTSNFSSSHVFKRLLSQRRQKVSLCGNGLNLIFSKTTGSVSTRFSRNVPWDFLFRNVWNFISSKTLVAMLTHWNFLRLFQEKSPQKPIVRFWVTLLKNCLRNIDPSRNIALMAMDLL